ncbi:hypothetical protein N7492_007929 [Penicillium capsulatum]|uniref:Uncharacterized protein n=1 Tax=Penicillium capsulatum TaxID=69766 RepID=A0A9W9I3D7_9EURO|nr:hypothetical protein N7492_007929 [Penicillium capsulatum]KAJ6117758.1 hypothetical protein N7512_007483 [Penicillium capsulatum]
MSSFSVVSLTVTSAVSWSARSTITPPSPVTLCGLPTTSLTWSDGKPTPIVWSCNPSAAATWSDFHAEADAWTCATQVQTLTVWITVDESSPTSRDDGTPATTTAAGVSSISDTGGGNPTTQLASSQPTLVIPPVSSTHTTLSDVPASSNDRPTIQPTSSPQTSTILSAPPSSGQPTGSSWIAVPPSSATESITSPSIVAPPPLTQPTEFSSIPASSSSTGQLSGSSSTPVASSSTTQSTTTRSSTSSPIPVSMLSSSTTQSRNTQLSVSSTTPVASSSSGQPSASSSTPVASSSSGQPSASSTTPVASSSTTQLGTTHPSVSSSTPVASSSTAQSGDSSTLVPSHTTTHSNDSTPNSSSIVSSSSRSTRAASGGSSSTSSSMMAPSTTSQTSVSTANSPSTLSSSSRPTHTAPGGFSRTSASGRSSPITSMSSQSTTTSQYQITDSVVTMVTVGAPQTRVCSDPFYSVSTQVSIPTGAIYIGTGNTEWGEPGTIWNISTGGGAKLTHMQAKCQGSSCAGINGDGNKNHDGKMIQLADGSWSMNVTEDMQASLRISGVLTANTKARRASKDSLKFPRAETKYPLKITGRPNCGYVAPKACDTNFFFSQQNWDAYRVEDFMESYISDHSLTNVDNLRARLYFDFYDTSQEQCDVTDPHVDCRNPPIDRCLKDPENATFIRGLLLTTAAVQYTKWMSQLYAVIGEAQDDLNGMVQTAVLMFDQPAAKTSRAKVLSIAAAAQGFLTGIGVMASSWSGELGAKLWGTFTSLSIMVASGLGTAAAVKALKETTPGEELFEADQKYTEQADNVTTALQKTIEELYLKDIGQQNLASIFASGGWAASISEYDGDWKNIWNHQGQSAGFTTWFKRALIARIVSKILHDQHYYLLHVPYGMDTKYNGKVEHDDDGPVGFTREECEKRWKGGDTKEDQNNGWDYWVDCDTELDDPGMTLFVRPYSQGAKTLHILKAFQHADTSFSPADIIKSAMAGQRQHGLGYSFFGQDDFKKTGLNDVNMKDAAEQYKDLKFTEPGVFTVPVCKVTDLVYVPGVGEVMANWQGVWGDQGFFQHTTDPCDCWGAYTVWANGTHGNFTDYVSDKVKESLDPSNCLGVQGYWRLDKYHDIGISYE